MPGPQHLQPVEVIAVEGAKLRRHILDLEASRVMHLARLVGRRLRRHIDKTPEDAVPDAEFVESAKWVSTTVLGLLKEQRARAELAKGQPMDDAEFERAFRAEVGRVVEAMSDEEFAELAAKRGRK